MAGCEATCEHAPNAAKPAATARVRTADSRIPTRRRPRQGLAFPPRCVGVRRFVAGQGVRRWDVSRRAGRSLDGCALRAQVEGRVRLPPRSAPLRDGDAGLPVWRPSWPSGPSLSSASRSCSWVFSPMVEAPLPSCSRGLVALTAKAVPPKVAPGPEADRDAPYDRPLRTSLRTTIRCRPSTRPRFR